MILSTTNFEEYISYVMYKQDFYAVREQLYATCGSELSHSILKDISSGIHRVLVDLANDINRFYDKTFAYLDAIWMHKNMRPQQLYQEKRFLDVVVTGQFKDFIQKSIARPIFDEVSSHLTSWFGIDRSRELMTTIATGIYSVLVRLATDIDKSYAWTFRHLHMIWYHRMACEEIQRKLVLQALGRHSRPSPTSNPILLKTENVLIKAIINQLDKPVTLAKERQIAADLDRSFERIKTKGRRSNRVSSDT